jgi:hypothetical protein
MYTARLESGQNARNPLIWFTLSASTGGESFHVVAGGRALVGHVVVGDRALGHVVVGGRALVLENVVLHSLAAGDTAVRDVRSTPPACVAAAFDK